MPVISYLYPLPGSINNELGTPCRANGEQVENPNPRVKSISSQRTKVHRAIPRVSLIALLILGKSVCTLSVYAHLDTIWILVPILLSKNIDVDHSLYNTPLNTAYFRKILSKITILQIFMITIRHLLIRSQRAKENVSETINTYSWESAFNILCYFVLCA